MEEEAKALARALAQDLAAERRRQKITQLQLAELAGVSSTAWKNAEQGKSIPTLPLLLAVARALGATLTLTLRQD